MYKDFRANFTCGAAAIIDALGGRTIMEAAAREFRGDSNSVAFLPRRGRGGEGNLWQLLRSRREAVRPGVHQAEDRRGIGRASAAKGSMGTRGGRSALPVMWFEAEGGKVRGHRPLTALLDMRVQLLLSHL